MLNILKKAYPSFDLALRLRGEPKQLARTNDTTKGLSPKTWEEKKQAIQAKNGWVTFTGDLKSTNPDEVHSFPSKSVFDALKITLANMCPPNCTTPANFGLVKSDEVKLLLQRFTTRFQLSNHSRGCKSAHLFKTLLDFAEAGLVHTVFSRLSIRAATPRDSAIDTFVKAWMASAVNFLTEQRCIVEEHGGRGVHSHDGEWYYRPGEGGHSTNEDVSDSDSDDEEEEEESSRYVANKSFQIAVR